MTMFRSAFTLFAIAGYASAQFNISAQCQIALTNTLAIPDFTNCSAATLFFTSISASFATNSSIVPSIELWLPSFCNSPQCSNATIAAVIQTIGEGCGSDLDINASIASLTSTIEQVYPTVRQIYCLEDETENCIIQFLNNVQATLGTIHFSEVLEFFFGKINVSIFPSNITCTKCNKAIYNELNQSSATQAVAMNNLPALDSQCGASFTNGSTPSSITESASKSTESSSTSSAFGGVSLLSHAIFTGLSASGLVVIISAFFTLLS